jgi:hypothetical protein
MVNLTSVSGGGSKKEKKTNRARKSPVSWIKRLGWEAGDLVRDASTAKKLRDAFSHCLIL